MPVARLAWLVVVTVGVLVVGLVIGLQLFPRLSAGQDVLDDSEHLFREDLVVAQRNASDAVNLVVAGVDPIAKAEGGAAGEVPELIAFVSQETGLSDEEVLNTLEERFPHTAALLLALPLEEVSAELPELIAFLAETLDLTPDEVGEALQANFPALAQSIDALPLITDGWATMETGLTDVNDEPLPGVAGIAEYLDTRIVDVTERQQGNFGDTKDTWPELPVLPWVLLAIGIVVVIYGGTMFVAYDRLK